MYLVGNQSATNWNVIRTSSGSTANSDSEDEGEMRNKAELVRTLRSIDRAAHRFRREQYVYGTIGALPVR